MLLHASEGWPGNDGSAATSCGGGQAVMDTTGIKASGCLLEGHGHTSMCSCNLFPELKSTSQDPCFWKLMEGTT